MPELPEVETIRLGLEQLIIGQKIADLNIINSSSFHFISTNTTQLIGAKITDVVRRGKVLIINLDNDCAVAIHLKMTGQIIYIEKNSANASPGFAGGHPNDSLISKLPDRSTRVVINFDNGHKLYFNDQRKFGWMRLMLKHELSSMSLINKMGPEPLGEKFTQREFEKQLSKRSNTNIKAALLDQSVIAGVGNIYADESLWSARIHPLRLVKTLSKSELAKLRKSIVAVLLKSIASGGSTDKNYLNAKGEAGSYLEFANVFRREGLPCPRCQSPLIKIRVAGRGTHVCTVCQKP